MKFLLDVNVLVAWGWSDHEGHNRVAPWIAECRRKRTCRLITTSISELGFVRVSVQRTGGKVTVGDAAEVLQGMLESLGKSHDFLPDDLSSARSWPDWCGSARHTTDAHLLELANRHRVKLATLDAGIPGAVPIP